MNPPLFQTAWSGQSAGEARFHCPVCRSERDGDRTVLRRHFLVLDRRLLPVRRPRAFLTCRQCGHAWPDDALADDGLAGAGHAAREDALSEDQRALLGAVAAMVLSDSAVRPVEKDVARGVVLHYTGLALPGTRMDTLLRSARVRWGDPVAHLVPLRWLVPETTRREILQAAYHVCTADRELHREESRLLNRMGEALGLGPRQVRAAMEEARRATLHAPGPDDGGADDGGADDGGADDGGADDGGADDGGADDGGGADPEDGGRTTGDRRAAGPGPEAAGEASR